MVSALRSQYRYPYRDSVQAPVLLPPAPLPRILFCQRLTFVQSLEPWVAAEFLAGQESLLCLKRLSARFLNAFPHPSHTSTALSWTASTWRQRSRRHLNALSQGSRGQANGLSGRALLRQ